MRILALSDIHIDYDENRQWIADLSDSDYKADVLLLAGDVSHKFDQLMRVISHLRGKFYKLFFVPGNHDLWIRAENWTDSVHKFNAIIDFCRKNDISIQPESVPNAGKRRLTIYPLFSWYTEPQEGEDTLYWHKPGEDPQNRMWSDNYFISWPNSVSPFHPVTYFTHLNESMMNVNPQGRVITFSHFIPRQEMMFNEFPPIIDMEKIKKYDRNPRFNFSRVAGSSLIDQQLRRLQSSIHVYGHQHINRDREVEGVRYLSHALGYPNERKRGMLRGIQNGLKTVLEI
ncbi:MAG: hypothetical protein GF313_06125 [Caldithrix sp.]|nr:hypothetical protein [Caldithrix sp.]